MDCLNVVMHLFTFVVKKSSKQAFKNIRFYDQDLATYN